MAEPYLTDLKAVLARWGGPDEISCKHFFSGAAAYADGHIFMSLSPAGLALKLPEEDRQEIFERGGKVLQYFPRAPVKKDYVILPPPLVDDESALADWILTSTKFVRDSQMD